MQAQLERQQHANSIATPLIPLSDSGVVSLPCEVLQPVLRYSGNLFPLRSLTRQFHQAADSLYEQYWIELKKSPPEGILDMPTLMQRIEERLAGRPYINLFKALEKEFHVAPLPNGRLPVTRSDFQVLQLAKKEYDHALLVLWKSIQRDVPIYLRTLNTADEIRQWLNNPANANAITRITTLHMEKCELRVLPKEIAKLTHLRYLYLYNNKLDFIPDFIANLTQLVNLDFSECHLTTLPNFIGNLTQLESLNLEGNKLISLPETIGNLTKLKTLRLNQNLLTSLPDSIGHLSQLEVLQLRRNALTSLPVTFTQLTRLADIILEHNKLTSLPDSLDILTQLRELRLFGNNLITLPDSLGNLNLDRLDVRNNKFMFLPESIINSQKSAIKSDEDIIKFKTALQYPSTSYLGQLLQLIMQRKEQEQIKAFFYSSVSEFAQDRILIFEMGWVAAERPNIELLQWGEHHAFEDMTRFYFAVRQAISTKLNRLPKDRKNQVYENIPLLDKSIERFYAEYKALDNLPLLADAMDMLKRDDCR